MAWKWMWRKQSNHYSGPGSIRTSTMNKCSNLVHGFNCDPFCMVFPTAILTYIQLTHNRSLCLPGRWLSFPLLSLKYRQNSYYKHNGAQCVCLGLSLSVYMNSWREPNQQDHYSLLLGHVVAQLVEALRFRFPMVSLEFFVDIILPATRWPWGWPSL